MPSIPLPFVVSFVLGLVLVRMMRRDRETFGLFGWLVAVCAVQAFLSGLHWGVGWPSARLLQPIIAAVLPALAFVAFQELRRGHATTASELLLHLVPAALVLGLVALWRWPIDIVLFGIYLGYGIALLHAARRGADSLIATRIGDSATAHKALVAIAVLLVLTAFVDAGVSFALVFGDARQATAILTGASVLWLAAAGYAATMADASRPDADPITSIMMEAGFGTKSNFHREFQRVTGMTPRAYRRLGSEAPAVPTAHRVGAAS